MGSALAVAGSWCVQPGAGRLGGYDYSVSFAFLPLLLLACLSSLVMDGWMDRRADSSFFLLGRVLSRSHALVYVSADCCYCVSLPHITSAIAIGQLPIASNLHSLNCIARVSPRSIPNQAQAHSSFMPCIFSKTPCCMYNCHVDASTVEHHACYLAAAITTMPSSLLMDASGF